MNKENKPDLPNGTRYIVIDRFEGEFAVLIAQDETTQDVLRSALPQGAKEGHWLMQYADGQYEIDEEKTQHRRTEMRARLDALLKRGK